MTSSDNVRKTLTTIAASERIVSLYFPPSGCNTTESAAVLSFLLETALYFAIRDKNSFVELTKPSQNLYKYTELPYMECALTI